MFTFIDDFIIDSNLNAFLGTIKIFDNSFQLRAVTISKDFRSISNSISRLCNFP
jgi:hypothetical protein